MTELVPTFIIKAVLSDDRTQVSLRASARFVKTSLYTPMTAGYIYQILEQAGFGKCRINKEHIDEIAEALAEALTQVEDEEDIKDLALETDTIAEAINASAEIEISDDKLHAVISITPAEGGKNISFNNAQELLQEMGVTYGIDEGRLKALLAKAQQATTNKKHFDKVAFALMPERGEDASFEALVTTVNEIVLKPRLRADGTADMHDLGNIPTVKENAPLMRKHPPTKGKKGINVCWEFIAPEPGLDTDFNLGDGTKISDIEVNVLVAEISGQPSLLECGMKVDEAVQVEAVDLHTGNLSLDANLLIKGDIADGMKVRCEGDITVGGVIESADVKAKGNIFIGKGIIGRTPEYSKDTHEAEGYTVSVQAGGSITAIFASYAKLNAGGDIVIAEQLLHCDSNTKGKVLVGNDKSHGSQIVGGITRASVSIEADILGAEAGVYTQLDLTGPFDLKQYEIACNHSILDGKNKMLKNMKDAYTKFMSIELTDARKDHITKIKNTVDHLEREILELNDRNGLLQDECEGLCQGLTVRAKRKIQPNVTVQIASSKIRTKRDRESGVYFYENGTVHYHPS